MVSRKKFIQEHGAECSNWTWSWSFVNHKDRFVIFGSWDIHQKVDLAKILSEKWKTNSDGRGLPGYKQSREHVRLIEEEGYGLFTFPQKFSDEHKDDDGSGPAKIGGFTPELTPKFLVRVGRDWFARNNFLNPTLPEEIGDQEGYLEGAKKSITVNVYERDPKARAACLKKFGYLCRVCKFDFESVYGPIGRQFIHVHHLIPFTARKEEYEVDPIKDLIPVCPNCHAIIHRTKPARTIAEMKELLKPSQ